MSKFGITKKERDALERKEKKARKLFATSDSLQNFALKLGVGTGNDADGATYGFNPITRNRQLLEWIHRGSWLGGVAIDLVADDMSRGGIDIVTTNPPDEVEQIQREIVNLSIWPAINDVVKWARLFGGGLGVMMIDGQDPKTELHLDRVGAGQFKGLLTLDRWSVEPSMNELVSEMGPAFGLPKYYRTMADSIGLPNMVVHHSRVVRMEGVRLPRYQRVSEMMWGMSIIERLYDRMIAFDSATAGAAQLVYKSYIRTYKIDGLREVVGMGGEALEKLVKFVDFMRKYQGIEGMTLLDMKDEFEAHVHQAFSGLSDALTQFGQQLSGALQIPLVRLFGQSPAGLNSTGESDLRTYYDGIKQQQERWLRVPMEKIILAIARSKEIELPDTFSFNFNPLWQMKDEDKVNAANQITTAVISAVDGGLVRKETGLKELRQSSRVTGVWSNITDEEIKEAENEPSMAELMQQGMGAPGGEAGGEEGPLVAKPPKGMQHLKQQIAAKKNGGGEGGDEGGGEGEGDEKPPQRRAANDRIVNGHDPEDRERFPFAGSGPWAARDYDPQQPRIPAGGEQHGTIHPGEWAAKGGGVGGATKIGKGAQEKMSELPTKLHEPSAPTKMPAGGTKQLPTKLAPHGRKKPTKTLPFIIPGGWSTSGGGQGEDVEVLVNPTMSEVEKMAQKDPHHFVRLGKMTKGDVIAVPASKMIHSHAETGLHDAGLFIGEIMVETSEVQWKGDAEQPGLYIGYQDEHGLDPKPVGPKEMQRWFRTEGEAEEFVSPNIGTLNFQQALNALHSARHDNFASACMQIDKAMRLHAQESDVIGAWSDGAEDTVMATVVRPDWQSLRAAAAMKGWLAHQKQALIFMSKEGGDSALISIKTPQYWDGKTYNPSLAVIHDTLLKAGVAFHTIQPAEKETRVLVLAHTPDEVAAVEKAADVFGKEIFKLNKPAPLTYIEGQAEFIGNHDDSGSDTEQRERARHEYESIIDAAQSAQLPSGEAAKRWGGIRNQWERIFEATEKVAATADTFYDEAAWLHEPRVPKGQPGGGQWTTGGGVAGGAAEGGDKSFGPYVPALSDEGREQIKKIALGTISRLPTDISAVDFSAKITKGEPLSVQQAFALYNLLWQHKDYDVISGDEDERRAIVDVMKELWARLPVDFGPAMPTMTHYGQTQAMAAVAYVNAGPDSTQAGHDLYGKLSGSGSQPLSFYEAKLLRTYLTIFRNHIAPAPDQENYAKEINGFIQQITNKLDTIPQDNILGPNMPALSENDVKFLAYQLGTPWHLGEGFRQSILDYDTVSVGTRETILQELAKSHKRLLDTGLTGDIEKTLSLIKRIGEAAAKQQEAEKAAAEEAEAAAAKRNAAMLELAKSGKVKLDERVAKVGGDKWNRETAIRLEAEYEIVKPEIDKLAEELVKAAAPTPREPFASWDEIDPDQQTNIKNAWMLMENKEHGTTFTELSKKWDEDWINADKFAWAKANKPGMLEPWTQPEAEPEPEEEEEIDESDKPYVPEEWDSLSGDDQEDVKNQYVKDNWDSYYDNEWTEYYLAERIPHHHLAEQLADDPSDGDFLAEALDEWLVEEEANFPGDTAAIKQAIEGAISFSVSSKADGFDEDGSDLEVDIDEDQLPTKPESAPDPNQVDLPGFEKQTPNKMFTEEMVTSLRDHLSAAFVKEIERRVDKEDPSNWVSEDSIRESLEESFDSMGDSDKFSWATHNTDVLDPYESDLKEWEEDHQQPKSKIKAEPEEVTLAMPERFDPMDMDAPAPGEGKKAAQRARDYRRTQALAKAVSLGRATKLIQDRVGKKVEDEYGVNSIHGNVADVDSLLWNAWKGASTEEDAKLLQAATAEELGGRLYWARFEKEAEQNKALGAIRPGVMPLLSQIKHRADKNYARIGGWEGVKAYIRAKWETSQWLLEKADMPIVDVYRSIDWDAPIGRIEDVEAPHETSGKVEHWKTYQRLPDIKVKRNGCASTTLSSAVANHWGGHHGTKVVLRCEVPRTAVISVPAYGINVHGEREVVITGTAWKAWEAWKSNAPDFEDIPIKAEIGGIAGDSMKGITRRGKDIVIDILQYEMENGLPYWLSPEGRGKARDYDPSEPRKPKGDPHGGEWTKGGGNVGSGGETKTTRAVTIKLENAYSGKIDSVNVLLNPTRAEIEALSRETSGSVIGRGNKGEVRMLRYFNGLVAAWPAYQAVHAVIEEGLREAGELKDIPYYSEGERAGFEKGKLSRYGQQGALNEADWFRQPTKTKVQVPGGATIVMEKLVSKSGVEYIGAAEAPDYPTTKGAKTVAKAMDVVPAEYVKAALHGATKSFTGPVIVYNNIHDLEQVRDKEMPSKFVDYLIRDWDEGTGAETIFDPKTGEISVVVNAGNKFMVNDITNATHSIIHEYAHVADKLWGVNRPLIEAIDPATGKPVKVAASYISMHPNFVKLWNTERRKSRRFGEMVTYADSDPQEAFADISAILICKKFGLPEPTHAFHDSRVTMQAYPKTADYVRRFWRDEKGLDL